MTSLTLLLLVHSCLSDDRVTLFCDEVGHDPGGGFICFPWQFVDGFQIRSHFRNRKGIESIGMLSWQPRSRRCEEQMQGDNNNNYAVHPKDLIKLLISYGLLFTKNDHIFGISAR